jgi:hypothetical protein
MVSYSTNIQPAIGRWFFIADAGALVSPDRHAYRWYSASRLSAPSCRAAIVAGAHYSISVASC